MPRPLRIEFPGATYHVMSHGVSADATFVDDVDRRCFLDGIEKKARRGDLLVHSFVLMTNHFHLLCETPEAGLATHMRHLLGEYVEWFNCRHERKGHLWRARYRALLVEDGDYFLESSRYIHLNPVRAGICVLPEEYRWSSYARYLGRGSEFPWIATARTLGFFPNCDYREFVVGNERPPRNPFKEAIRGVVFGSKEFAERVKGV